MAAAYAICEKKVVVTSFDAVLNKLKAIRYPVDLPNAYYVIAAKLDAHFENPVSEVTKLEEIHKRIKLEIKADNKRKLGTLSEMGIYGVAFKELRTGETFSLAKGKEIQSGIDYLEKDYGKEILNTLAQVGFKKGKELDVLVSFIIGQAFKKDEVDLGLYVQQVTDFKNHLENNNINVSKNTSSYPIIGRIFDLNFNETDAQMIGQLSKIMRDSKIKTLEKQRNDYSAFRVVHDWKEKLQDDF